MKNGDLDLFVCDSLREEVHFGRYAYLTSSLDSHPHLGGAHAAALIRVSLFEYFLAQRQQVRTVRVSATRLLVPHVCLE